MSLEITKNTRPAISTVALIGAVALFVGTAHAADYEENACPEATEIEWNVAFTAAARDGKQWKGWRETPRRLKHMKGLAFSEAYIHNTKHFVSCDYSVGKGGVRMTLRIDRPVEPTGKSWLNEMQTDGTTLPRCAGSNPSLCTFK
jgi:hypothetical protein